MNADELRQTEHTRWSRVAAGWYKYDTLVTRSTRAVTEQMLAQASLKPGNQVLDLASGTGEPALPAAERVGRSGRVVGTDLVEDMLVFARKKAEARGLGNIEFQCVGAEAVDFKAGSFDVVTMRWGIMFVADPLACMTRVRQLLKPGGRLVVAAWAQPDQNPFFTVPSGVLARNLGLKPPPPDAPGVFRFSSEEKLRQVLEQAGFVDLEFTTADVLWGEFPTGKDFWNFTVELAGPLIQLIESQTDEMRLKLAEEVAKEAERFRTSSGVVVPGKTWVVVAKVPAAPKAKAKAKVAPKLKAKAKAAPKLKAKAKAAPKLKAKAKAAPKLKAKAKATPKLKAKAKTAPKLKAKAKAAPKPKAKAKKAPSRRKG